jgi:hypothetical protein
MINIVLAVSISVAALSSASARVVASPRARGSNETLHADISQAKLAALIDGFLVENAPAVQISLQNHLIGNPPLGYADMVRADLLEEVDASGQPCPGPAYALTSKGRDEARSRGWSVHDTYATIPLGRFVYEPRSVKVERAPNAFGQRKVFAITFRYRFYGNANSEFLLTLGPYEHWRLAGYIYPTLTMNRDGSVSTMKLMLSQWKGIWSVGRFPYYEAPPCGSD